MLVLGAAGCTSSESGGNGKSGASELARAEELNLLDSVHVKRFPNGWYLADVVFLDSGAVAGDPLFNELKEEMLLVSRLKLLPNGDYQQLSPNPINPQKVFQYRGRWRYQPADRLLLLRQQNGSARDTARVVRFTADSLVMELGMPPLRQRHIYRPAKTRQELLP